MARVPRSAQSRFVAVRKDRRFELRDDRLVDTKRNELYPWGLPNHVTVEFGTLGRSSSGEVAGSPMDGPLRFTPDGLPADDASTEALAHEVEPWLFVVDGRLRPASSAPPTSEDPVAWECYMRNLGYADPDSAYSPVSFLADPDALAASLARKRAGRLTAGRTRACPVGGREMTHRVRSETPPAIPPRVFTCSDKRWRETLIARVATLFDQNREEQVVIEVTDLLLTGCVSMHSLPDPLREVLERAPYRQRCFDRLWSACFRRRQLAWSRCVTRAPITVEFAHRGTCFRFVIPKRRPGESEARHRRGVDALRFLNQVSFAEKRGVEDRDLVAAALWAGQEFLVPKPVPFRRRSLDAVCRDMGANSRRARRLYHVFTHEPPLLMTSWRRILSRKGGRPSTAERRALEEHLWRQRGARLTEAELRQEHGAEAAFALLDKANLMEHGFKYGRGLPVPAARTVRRARTLRRRALRELDRIRTACGRRLSRPVEDRSERRP